MAGVRGELPSVGVVVEHLEAGVALVAVAAVFNGVLPDHRLDRQALVAASVVELTQRGDLPGLLLLLLLLLRCCYCC